MIVILLTLIFLIFLNKANKLNKIGLLMLLILHSNNVNAALIGAPDGPICYEANMLDDLTGVRTQVLVDAINQPTFDYTSLITQDVVLPDGTIETIKVPKAIPATDPIPKWVKVEGLTLEKGEDVKIFTQGTIDLCGNTLSDVIKVAGNIDGWVKTNIKIDLRTTSIFLNLSLNNTTLIDPDAGNNEVQNGNRLYVYIGNDSAPPSLDPDKSKELGTDFFELHRENKINNQVYISNNFSGKPSAEGTIWLRYRDADAQKGSWGTNFANNIGEYEVRVTTPCEFANGDFLIGYIGDADPNTPRLNPDDHQSNTSMQYIGMNYFDPPGKAWESGKLWFAIWDKPDQYLDNFGSYKVLVAANSSQKIELFTDINNGVLKPVKSLIDTATSTMFTKILGNNNFQKVVRVTLVLYISLTFIYFMFGLMQITQLELVARITKISLLLFLVSPIVPGKITPWQFFYEHFFSIFLDGLVYLTNLMLSIYNPLVDLNATEIDLSFFDKLVVFIFEKSTLIKVFSLFFSGLLGIVLFIIIVVSFVSLIMASIKAVLIYTMAHIAMSLLIIVSPVLILFILFGMTKEVFDNWIKLMLNYIFQPTLVFLVVVLYSFWIFSVIRYALGFAVCQKCVLGLTLPFDFLSFFGLPEFKFCIMEFYQPWGYDNSSSLLGSLIFRWGDNTIAELLFPAIILLILTTSMSAFINFAIKMANSLVQIFGSNLGESAGAAAGGVVAPIKDIAESAKDFGAGVAKGIYQDRKKAALSDKIQSSDNNSNKMGRANVSDPAYAKSSVGNLDRKDSKVKEVNISNSQANDMKLNKSNLDTLNIQKGSNINSLTADHSDIRNMNLSGTQMNNSTINNSKINEFNLSNSNLRNLQANDSTLYNLSAKNDTTMQSATISRSYINGMKIDNSNMDSFNVQNNSNLSNMSVNNSNAQNMTFDRTSVNVLSINKSEADNASFVQSKISNVSVDNSNIKNANLNNSDLSGVNIKNANLENVNLNNAKIQGSNFEGVNLKDVDLSGQQLKGVKFDTNKDKMEFNELSSKDKASYLVNKFGVGNK